MEELIPISWINDFLFCPASIYYHNMVGCADRIDYQTEYQINGTNAHRTIDNGTYSTRKNILQGITIISEKYGLIGKIDVFDVRQCLLIERKKHINRIFDGHILQMYAQYYGMVENGYDVKRLKIHSIDDNRNYEIPLPDEDIDKSLLFTDTLEKMRVFDIGGFKQYCENKCKMCIYNPLCANTDYHDD